MSRKVAGVCQVLSLGVGWGVIAILLSAIWAGAAPPVAGQFVPDTNDEPYWMRRLTCDPAHQTYQGLNYCTGLEGRAHVLVVDLYDQAGVQFDYVLAQGMNRNGGIGPCRDVNLPAYSTGPGCYDPATNTFPIMSLMDAVRRVPGVVAVIDTDYGAKSGGDRGHGPEGLTVVMGDRLDGPLPNGPNDLDNNAVRRPWLALGSSAPYQAHMGQLSVDTGDLPFGWVYTGVGGGPWLIRDGNVDETAIENCTNADSWSCTSDEAQAGIALSRGRRWLYLVVIDGEDAAGLADFMMSTLAPWSAIKLDGGGSTQMWYGGLPGSTHQDRVAFAESGRLLSQYLAVVAPPGAGIQPASPALSAAAVASSTTIILDQGETATLTPSFLNDGVVEWTTDINISLASKPVLGSVFGAPELSDLPHPVPPGSTVSWSFPADTSGVHSYRYQMVQDELYFGEEKQFLVIVIPEALKDKRDELEALIAELQAQGKQEVEELAQAVEEWLLTEGAELAEGALRRVGRILADLLGRLLRALEAELATFCNSLLIIPPAVGVVWLRRRR